MIHGTFVSAFVAAASTGSCVALAAPVPATFAAGSVVGAGFPEPLVQQSAVSTSSKRSGGGSTGGGFGGTATASMLVTPTANDTAVALSGTATHTSDFGYTAAYTQQDVVLSLTQPANYSIANLSRTLVNGTNTPFLPVTFQGITGAITATSATTGKMTAGTYRLRFGVAAGRPDTFSFSEVAAWYNQFTPTGCASTVVDWKLTLTKPCTGDLNNDGMVDDTDFSRFVVAYDILGCAQPGMPAGCPSDFNNDGVVDDSDFVLFVQAYNALLCP